MIVPSSNLLNLALSTIKKDSFQVLPVKSRVLSAKGQYVSQYNAAVTLQGSVQPVPRNRYQQLGLDFNKNYIQIYASFPIVDVRRDSSGDLVLWNGRKYEVMSNNDWIAIDGWLGVLAVDVGAA